MRYDPPFHRTAGFRPVILALALLVLLPFVATDTYIRHIFILAFIFAIVAASWDLSLGTGGMFNFAHVAMFAVGIYAYGLLTSLTALSPWLALPFAGLIAALVAAVITVPILRLSGIYIILVTVAASQVICQLVISQSDYTGGTNGLVGLPTLSLFGSPAHGQRPPRLLLCRPVGIGGFDNRPLFVEPLVVRARDQGHARPQILCRVARPVGG